MGPINLPAGDGPSSVAVADFNADGRADIAVTNELVDNVSILLGTTLDGYPRPAGRDAVQGRARPRLQRVSPGQREPDPRAAPRTRVMQPAGSELRLRDDRLARCELGPRPVAGLAAVRSGGAADVTLEASITDVRNKAGLADYAGELQARVTLRLTDKVNGGSLTESGTLGDRTFAFTLPCSPTGGRRTSEAPAACRPAPTRSFQGSSSRASARSGRWARLRCWTAGPTATWTPPTGNTVFARQGVFVP